MPAVGGVASPAFVARADELARLHAAYDRAVDGAAAAVAIAGEAGVGKSRLLSEFTSHVGSDGGRAFVGGAIEFHKELPYAPVVEALRPLFATTDQDLFARVVGRPTRELAALFPQLDRDEPREAADNQPSAQARLFEQLLGLLGRLSLEAPTVLALEDLHWADASTHDLFSFLVRNVRSERVVLVATYRDDEVDRRHPLHARLAQLGRDPRIERLQLSRFGREEFDRQVAGISERAVSSAVADRIFERSGGNPLFTEELLATETASARGQVPPTIRDALLARADRLTDKAQRVLKVAAVAGGDVDTGLLVAVSRLAPESVERALREAETEHVMVRPHEDERGRYSFRHALMQEALYGELLPTERSRLHGFFAEALTADASLARHGADLIAAELAFHWRRAQRWPEALASALAAADQAAAGYAFPEELTHLEHVLDVWDRVDAMTRADLDRATVAERAAISAERIGDPSHASALLELALRDVDRRVEPLRAGRLYARLADTRLFLDDIERGEMALDEAARLIGSSTSRERVELLSVAVRWRNASARARAISVDAAAVPSIERGVGDARLEAQARAVTALAIGYVGDPRMALEHLVAARQIGEELSDPGLVTRSMHMLGHVYDGAGRFGDAVDVFTSGAARSRELGMERSEGHAMEMDAAESLRQLGRWQEAEAIVARVLDEIERFGTYGSPQRHAIPAHLYVGLGRFDDAERQLAAAWQGSRQTGAGGLAGHIFAARAELAIWRARWDEARDAVAEGLARIGTTEELRWIATVAALGLRAESERASLDRVRGHQAEVDEAMRVGAALLETVRTTAAKARDAAWPEGEGHRALAEAEWQALSGLDDPQLWREAAQRWSELGVPYPEAYARLREAQALRRLGGARVDVAAAVSAALAIASALGAGPLMNAIEAFMRVARVRLVVNDPREVAQRQREPPIAPQFGLTDREREVLVLLAGGRTNREIAEALYISESTAGVHVSNIIGKLGASNRVEAAALAVRLELAGGVMSQ